MVTENASRQRPTDETLQVDLRLTPDDFVNCPLLEAEEDIDTARINAVGETCTVDLIPADGSTPTRATGIAKNGCFCRIFNSKGCVPTVQDVDGRTVLLRTYVADRETVRNLVATLREKVGQVSLERLAVVDDPDPGPGPDPDPASDLDVVSLTEKQREALELAVERGYFDGDVTLGTLADELGISKSALSQRLRGGQAKLARAAVET